VEVLTLKEANQIPVMKLQEMEHDDYEIRVIIWETREVPLVDNGESVDIYIVCEFFKEGWSAESIRKSTDIHYNSRDGRGVFNWRMKY